MHTNFWLKNLKGRDHLKDLDVGGRIILEMTHLDQDSDHGNEPAGSRKGK